MEGRSHRMDSDNSHPEPEEMQAITCFPVDAAFKCCVCVNSHVGLG